MPLSDSAVILSSDPSSVSSSCTRLNAITMNFDRDRLLQQKTIFFLLFSTFLFNSFLYFLFSFLVLPTFWTFFTTENLLFWMYNLYFSKLFPHCEHLISGPAWLGRRLLRRSPLVDTWVRIRNVTFYHTSLFLHKLCGWLLFDHRYTILSSLHWFHSPSDGTCQCKRAFLPMVLHS